MSFVLFVIAVCSVLAVEVSGETWSRNPGKYLGGYSAGTAKYDALVAAQSECLKRSDCGGITYETGSKMFTLRKGVELKGSPSNEVSFMVDKEDGCVKENADFRGSDIKMVPNVVSIMKCIALCSAQTGCASLTHQPSTLRCYLKNREFSDAQSISMNGVNSRNIKCQNDVGCWDKANRAAKKAGYKGTQSVTKEGFTCQKWTEQSPQSHSYTVATYGAKGVGDHNYCRNPAEKYDQTWCYTTDPAKRWDWCVVPTCPAKLEGAWTQIAGGLRRINKGKSGVWGVNSGKNVYKLNDDGASWTQITGQALTHVASGSEVWGVNNIQGSTSLIYKYLGDNKWQTVPGQLKNIDVSDNGNVWGVNTGGNIYRWLGAKWQQIQGKAIEVSVGMSGVWVVNSANNIYYRSGTRGDSKTPGTKWELVPGKLKWIASGRDIVVGVNAADDIFYRDGISNAAPTGTKWVKINGKLSQISVFDDQVLGTNKGQSIFRTPYIAPKAPVLAGQTSKPLGGLQVGDKITYSGVFTPAVARFGMNIKDSASNFLFRMAFRPAGDGSILVMDSRKNGNWQGQLRSPLPAFEEGKEFKITVSVLEEKYIASFNGELMAQVNFPKRQPYNGATTFELWGGAALKAGGVPILWNTIIREKALVEGEGEDEDQDETEVNILTKDLVATQNSVGWGGVPARALDGNTNGQWKAGTCTHTSTNINNWWRVKLDGMYKVDRVVLYNREDCCQNRINLARVYVGAVLCGEVAFKTGQSKYVVSCGGAIGGAIKVSLPYNYLTLCEVQAYGQETEETQLKNVAAGMPTWSSSVGWGGVASRGVDRKSSGIWAMGTCTHSANAGFNQWRVDLLDHFDVDAVVIYNRLDCCQNRINGAKVYVDDTLCGAVEWVAGYTVFRVSCNGASGSKVKITQDGQYLTLCEVQVLAKPSDDLGALINIAEDGTATQSTVGWGGIASRAIDGNIAAKYPDGSCSHTGNVNSGWWNLEFPEPVPVSKVVIYNRKDCCGNRIDGVTVYADDVLCGTIRYVEKQDVYKVACSSDLVENVVATNIRIKAAPKQFLTLCEVKVLSDPTAEIGEDALVNLAYLKPTSQSSTGWGGVPDRAVDGKESGTWSKGTCTHTTGPGWWMVDLKDNYAVEKIWIKNRMDCCSDRIDGVKVYVGDFLCGTVKYNPIKYSYEVECEEGHGAVGQTVKIVNDKTFLTLCEVKVWGPKDPVIEDMASEDEVVGDKSAAVDDATSAASCPVGKVVTYCEVATGQVGVNSDGALVNAHTGAVCVAYNGWGGAGVIAKAVCTENEQIGDPCNGPKLQKYKHLYSKGASPSLECPVGYEPVICNAHSFWWDQLTNKGISDVGVIPNDAACAVPNCSDQKWCDVTLVCKLMDDLNAYAAKVCPNCEGWNCAAEEVCDMVEAEDESDVKVPSCSEKQTGCDLERCGDHGECEAVGADDYTCDCEDGFEFDESAGTCMPKHSKYRTVYGEKALGDDAHSYASCNEGEKVMRCHTFGMPGAADGVTITSSNGVARCEARASNSKKFPIMAVAYCGDDSVFTDPCTQDEIHGIEYRSKSDKSPSVECPGGYVMESCIFHSPWSQQLTAENKLRINSIGAVDINDDGTCSMDNCLSNPAGHQWCKLTAVCKKLTGSEYLKAACPTCEQVRCPAEQECQMVKELPMCVPRIPGGCEEDKCGKGECQEDGPNYKCLCDEGYKFDGKTCSDVDECAEEPCGNGECTNTPGSYTCECNKGYELVHGSCEDINECLDNPCDDTERCSNVEGSFICDCLDTFVKDPKTKDCVCTDGYENEDGKCVDIDECEDDPCGENQDCFNEVGNYHCECKEGTEKGQDGSCMAFKLIDCDIKAKKAKVKGFKGTNVNVKLVGEKKKTLKKYATITWEKNNDPWNPSDDGKDKLSGFTIRNFDVDDVGVYVASIFIDIEGEVSKCQVEVETELIEGSVTLTVENEDALMKPQKAGKELKIKCDLDLVNVKLDDPKNPDNVNWYKVTEDGEELLDDSDTIGIERGRGVYILVFKNPTPEDTGTYRCEFDQMGIEVTDDVTIEVV